jgi:hypothetical protein
MTQEQQSSTSDALMGIPNSGASDLMEILIWGIRLGKAGPRNPAVALFHTPRFRTEDEQ